MQTDFKTSHIFALVQAGISVCTVVCQGLGMIEAVSFTQTAMVGLTWSLPQPFLRFAELYISHLDAAGGTQLPEIW